MFAEVSPRDPSVRPSDVIAHDPVPEMGTARLDDPGCSNCGQYTGHAQDHNQHIVRDYIIGGALPLSKHQATRAATSWMQEGGAKTARQCVAGGRERIYLNSIAGSRIDQRGLV